MRSKVSKQSKKSKDTHIDRWDLYKSLIDTPLLPYDISFAYIGDFIERKSNGRYKLIDTKADT